MNRTGLTRLLVISHEASRSGAPILLLETMRWLARTSDIRFDILLLRDGPLRAEFEACGTTWLADELTGRRSTAGRIWNRVGGRTDDDWIDKACRSVLRRTRPNAVYGNTVLSLPWLAAFKKLAGLPGVCHFHEMAWAIEQFFPRRYVQEALVSLEAVVACSEAVAADLHHHHSVETSKMTVVPSFIDPEIRLSRAPAAVRRELGIPDSAFVVGGVGRAEMRKGTDLMVQLLARLVKHGTLPDVRVVWVGVSPHDEIVSICRHDLQVLGLLDRFVFVDQTPDPNDYIACFDVFALTSREEPMGLAAMAGVCLDCPVVGFAGRSGVIALLGSETSHPVPFLDLDAMTEAVVRIAQDRSDSQRRAIVARERVVGACSLETVAPVLRDVIARVAS